MGREAGGVVGRQVAQYAKHIGIKTINIVPRHAGAGSHRVTRL